MELVFTWKSLFGGPTRIHAERVRLTPKMAVVLDYAASITRATCQSTVVEVDDMGVGVFPHKDSRLEIQFNQHGKHGAGIGQGFCIVAASMHMPYLSRTLPAEKWAKVREVVNSLPDGTREEILASLTYSEEVNQFHEYYMLVKEMK